MHIVTNGTASSVVGDPLKPATLIVRACAGRINDRRRDHLAEVGNEAVSALDLFRDFGVGHLGRSSCVVIRWRFAALIRQLGAGFGYLKPQVIHRLVDRTTRGQITTAAPGREARQAR